MYKTIINGMDYAYIPSPRGVSVIGAMKSYATYEEFLSDADKGAFAWVDDATGDPTVNHGGALYRIKADKSIQKIMETESMDQIFSFDVPWERLINKPVSDVNDIDMAVLLQHEHPNKDLLDLIAGTKEEATYNSYPIITTINFGKYLGKYLEDIEGSKGHVHANLSILNTLDVIDNRPVINSVPLALLRDLPGVEELAPLRFEPTVSGTVDLDLALANGFIFTGSDGYLNLQFKNVDHSRPYRGYFLVKPPTKILWPKGMNTDTLTWAMDHYPEDVSTVSDTNAGFIYEYYLIDHNVYLHCVTSTVNLNVEE